MKSVVWTVITFLLCTIVSSQTMAQKHTKLSCSWATLWCGLSLKLSKEACTIWQECENQAGFPKQTSWEDEQLKASQWLSGPQVENINPDNLPEWFKRSADPGWVAKWFLNNGSGMSKLTIENTRNNDDRALVYIINKSDTEAVNLPPELAVIDINAKSQVTIDLMNFVDSENFAILIFSANDSTQWATADGPFPTPTTNVRTVSPLPSFHPSKVSSIF